MIVINPDSENKNYDDKKLVFLAGPIKGAENWQDKTIEALADLDIYIANPRREYVPNFNLEEQVEWETKFLRRADVIMFWIPVEHEHVEGRSYAQTSRFELGEWCGRTDFNQKYEKIVLGIEDGFPGKGYIEKRFIGSGSKVLNSYEQTLAKVRELLTTKPKIFFTSDTHFDSARALEMSKRPFSSVAEMNQQLVDNWNKLVKPDDVVYHLGDFGNLDFVSKLNGEIHLIAGNYEEDLIAENPDYLQKLGKSFKSVLRSEIITLADGSKLHLSHKPSEADCSMFNAFGHIHGRQLCKKFGVDVGVDGHHFRPISEAELLFYKNAIQTGKYDNEVFL